MDRRLQQSLGHSGYTDGPVRSKCDRLPRHPLGTVNKLLSANDYRGSRRRRRGGSLQPAAFVDTLRNSPVEGQGLNARTALISVSDAAPFIYIRLYEPDILRP